MKSPAIWSNVHSGLPEKAANARWDLDLGCGRLL